MITWKLLKQTYQAERDFQLRMHHCRNRLSTRLYQELTAHSTRSPIGLALFDRGFRWDREGHTAKTGKRRKQREEKKRKQKGEGKGKGRGSTPALLLSHFQPKFYGSSLAQFIPYHLANYHRLYICLADRKCINLFPTVLVSGIAKQIAACCSVKAHNLLAVFFISQCHTVVFNTKSTNYDFA